MPSSPAYRIGLAANRSHQDSPDSALVRLLRDSDAAIRQLQAQFVVVGRTLDAMQTHKLLPGYPLIERFPYGREGGLMRLVARVVETDPARRLDAVIYLMDPVDPSSSFPEALALKRQCVVHGKPFLSTLAGAREWMQLEALAAGAPADAGAPGDDLANEAITLVAHDKLKDRMIELAERHFDFLDRFAVRYATGTTGGLLNELARKIKGGAAGRNWVRPFLSGPLGGDAQIAELILDRQCRRVIFLEDPHVARQHEADIQLLERAARTVTDFTCCVSDVQNADRWLSLLALRQALR